MQKNPQDAQPHGYDAVGSIPGVLFLGDLRQYARKISMPAAGYCSLPSPFP